VSRQIEFLCLAGVLMLSQLACAQISATAAQPAGGAGSIPDSEVWRFDQTGLLGGHPATVLGHPRVIESPYGKAVEFNGVDDALFVGVHPLAGVSTFTWEVVFRPDADGAGNSGSFIFRNKIPKRARIRIIGCCFEIRIVDGQWCLDSFATTAGEKLTLLNCKLLHPLGKWYRVTAVYDGKEFRNYVGDELEGSGELKLGPQLAGHSSAGSALIKGTTLKERFSWRG